MKKVLLVVAAIALFAGSVNAGPLSFIGIYTDGGHTVCRQDILAPYVSFPVWVWVQPSDNGMICSEFMLQYPAWLLNIGTVVNPNHSVALGDPFSGISICFAACQTDWTYLYQLTALPTAAGVPGFVNVLPHPSAGAIQIANCLPDYPLEPLLVFNNLRLNQDCEVITGAEDTSWGAIKGMYSE
jgi:hypothetical protein